MTYFLYEKSLRLKNPSLLVLEEKSNLHCLQVLGAYSSLFSDFFLLSITGVFEPCFSLIPKISILSILDIGIPDEVRFWMSLPPDPRELRQLVVRYNYIAFSINFRCECDSWTIDRFYWADFGMPNAFLVHLLTFFIFWQRLSSSNYRLKLNCIKSIICSFYGWKFTYY